MRSSGWVLAAVLLAPPTDASELSTPEALLDQHIEAFNRADSEALASLYAEDAKVHAPGGRVIRGRQEIEKFWRSEQGRDRRRLRLTEVERETSGGIAYVIGSYSFTRPNKRGTFTMCFKRGEGGSWRIVASMWNQGQSVGYTPLLAVLSFRGAKRRGIS